MPDLAGVLLLATEVEGEDPPNPLIPNVNELVWGTICFAIFVAFMLKYVLPLARKALDERTRGIEGKLAQAEADRNEAQALLAQYRQQLAEARGEAGRIRTEAQTQRAEIVEEARVEARGEAERITAAATAQIATERATALAELRRDVGTLAVDLASRIVGESLQDDARRNGTVERYLSELEGTAFQDVGTPHVGRGARLMDGVSRESMRTALTRFEEQVGTAGDARAAGRVSEGLYAVAALLDREPSLRRALTDPASSPDSRRGLVQGLFGSQLDALPLSVLSDLAVAPWHSPVDLREAVETLAAQAALVSAEADGVLDDVEDELFRFARLLEREPQLRAALTDPGLPAERKTGLLETLLAPQAKAATIRLVEVAVTRPRGRSLETVLDELSRLAAARRHRLVAEVRAAAPLTAAQTGRLSAVLAQIYGRQVLLQVDVDPRVLGGMQVRVGDEVLDGTVVRRLDDVRRRLAR